MGTKENITSKVKRIMNEDFEFDEVNFVPDISNSRLTFGNKGLKFSATVLYIDMIGSTKILKDHNKTTVAKIHMSYFHTLINIVKPLGGEVRSFNGDSMLAFFPGTTKTTKTNAVKAAMQMNYMISNSDSGINTYLAKYSAIDFRIGLAYGDILCTKIGVADGDSNTKDIFWIGHAVNKAVKLSDEAVSPYHICISKNMYAQLEDRGILSEGVNMWDVGRFNYKDITEEYYYTSYYWEV